LANWQGFAATLAYQYVLVFWETEEKRRKRKPGRDAVIFHLFAVSVIVLCHYWNASASAFLDK